MKPFRLSKGMEIPSQAHALHLMIALEDAYLCGSIDVELYI